MHVVTLQGTTSAGGGATVYSEKPVLGAIQAVFVEAHNLDDGADLTLGQVFTDNDGAEAAGELFINNGDIGNAGQNAYYPRRIGQNADGTDLEVATGQDVPVPYIVAGQLLKAVVANGGATKRFTIHVVVD